jgi:chromosome segregation ATPase
MQPGAPVLCVLLALCSPVALHASAASAQEAQRANPIRKVVMMLQNMQAQVTKEGETELALYDKFMCYCETGEGDLKKSIEVAKAKIESLTSSIKVATESKSTTTADLEAHTASREEAKAAMASATALRTKEAAVYAKFKSDSDTNDEALTGAIAAVSKGVGAAFLQTKAADTVRNFAMDKAEMSDATRQLLLSFLSGSSSEEYVPQSGQILGILKQMQDEMSHDLSEATDAENSAISTYEALMAAKTKEVETLQAQLEAEMTRAGELGVEITTMENDLEDTEEALAEDTTFLAELGSSCATKTKEWEEIKATRAEELLALAETIKVLNDDDALELFKKTLPSASASFVQLQVSAGAARAKALEALRAGGAGHSFQTKSMVDFIELALQGKQMGFDKVVAMIDQMVLNLKKEQEADDALKSYCDKEFDSSDDKKKQLELSISDSETAIEELTGSIAMLKDEIEALEDSVKALDKSVAEATEMRKEENSDYKELMANDANAKEVLLWAKNRLNKFYNPKLYKAPPTRVLGAEDSIVVSMGGTLAPTSPPGGIAGTGIALAQVSAHTHRKDAPGPPPETFGAYSKKTEEGTGVISMIDLLVKDLEKEMQESKVSEEDSQSDYEKTMADAASKRAADSKSITEKTAAKASAEGMLQDEESKKAETSTMLAETIAYISQLHGQCDFLLKYFQVRKDARDSEIDALGKAKAVLSGADFSLVQTARAARSSLRR